MMKYIQGKATKSLVIYNISHWKVFAGLHDHTRKHMYHELHDNTSWELSQGLLEQLKIQVYSRLL